MTLIVLNMEIDVSVNEVTHNVYQKRSLATFLRLHLELLAQKDTLFSFFDLAVGDFRLVREMEPLELIFTLVVDHDVLHIGTSNVCVLLYKFC